MTESKRKLIFCWPYVEWGGAQVYFMSIMKEAKSDWDVRVILPAESSAEVRGLLEEIGIRYETIDFRLELAAAHGLAAKLRRQLNRIRVELGLLRYLRRYDLSESILHIETSPWQSWIFLTLLRLRQANVFVTMHNAITGSRWRQMLWKVRMHYVTRLRGFNLFVSNRDTKDRIKSWARESYWRNIPATYTCVDPVQIERVLATPIDRPARRRRLGVSETEIVVLCVGQFIDRKGRWDFIEAARELEEKSADIKFVWVAPQSLTPEDTLRVKEIGAGNFQLMLSASIGSTRDEVLSFFRLADVFALPSYVEGLPIALLEAMALGLPSISTNVHAIPEAVINDVTGLLIEPDDPSGLAAAVKRFASDRNLRERIARVGQEFVLKTFDERAAAKIAIDAYNRCFPDARVPAK